MIARHACPCLTCLTWRKLTFSQTHEQFKQLLPISTGVLILTTLTDALEEFVSRIVSCGLPATGLFLEERLNLIEPGFSLDSPLFQPEVSQ